MWFNADGNGNQNWNNQNDARSLVFLQLYSVSVTLLAPHILWGAGTFTLALFSMPTSRQTQLLTDLFTAYFSARKHKRNKLSQLQFEKHYESNIIQLREDIINDRYSI